MIRLSTLKKINPVTIEKSRRLQPEAPLNEQEKSSLRSIVGALQYAAVHSRPDLAAKVGELQSAVNRSTVNELLQANKVLTEAKQHRVSLMVLPINPDDLTFVRFQMRHFYRGSRIMLIRGP